MASGNHLMYAVSCSAGSGSGCAQDPGSEERLRFPVMFNTRLKDAHKCGVFGGGLD